MNRSYLTVTALTRYIKQKFDRDHHLTDVWLKGEISNFNHHRRGHMYMTIKDEESRIQSVMFAGNNRSLKFVPENGMNVIINGYISVFEPYGQYQLYIKQMEPDGLGALHLAFEQLKEKLDKQGYFNQALKKPIPRYPSHIGLVTSPTGAAVRDMITTIKRRYPIVNVTVIPVQVQGEDAALSIKRGIELAHESHKPFDLLIVGRGGGSIEDLWAFNEEVLAEAIFKATIPIISAVGHETDTTISDFVSDLRAPTPTAAAELAVPSIVDLNEKLSSIKAQLTRNIQLILNDKKETLNVLAKSYGLRTPKQIVQQKEQELDYLEQKLNTRIETLLKENHYRLNQLRLSIEHHNPAQDIKAAQERLKRLTEKSDEAIRRHLQTSQDKFLNLIEQLSLLNPLAIMKRGYSIAYKDDKEIMKSVEEIDKNDEITVRLVDGYVDCSVQNIRRNRDDQ